MAKTNGAQAGEPRVMVYLPLLEEDGVGGKVDQTEHVTVTNPKGSKTYVIQRGVHVEVLVPVFEQLRNKFPNL